MAHRVARILAMAAALVCVAGAAGGADLKTLTKELFAVPSTTGNEDMLAAKIRGLLPKGLTVEDAGLGTIAVRLGGTPGPTLILAALDGYGHMVSGITPEGYLTLDRPVAAAARSFRRVPPRPAGRHLDGQRAGPGRRLPARDPSSHAGAAPDPGRRILPGDRLRRYRRPVREGRPGQGRRASRRGHLSGRSDGARRGPVGRAGARDEGRGRRPRFRAEALAGRTAGEETDPGLGGPDEVRGPRPGRAPGHRRRAGQGPSGSRSGRSSSTSSPRARAMASPSRTEGRSSSSPRTGLPTCDRPSRRPPPKPGASLQFLTAPDTPLALPFEVPPAEVVTLALPVRFLNTPSEVVALKDLQALCDILEQYLRPGGAK